MPKKTAHAPALAIEKRTTAGTTSAKAARRAGKIPGVLYGHGEPTPVAIDAKTFTALLHGGGHSVVDASVDGRPDSLVVRSVQRDPISHHPIHVDFQRVHKGEAISATIAVIITGTPRVVRDASGVLDIVTRTIEVKGPSDKIPNSVTVDVNNLGVHQHVSAGDLVLPAGFTLLTPADAVIASVEPSRTAQQAEESAPAAAAAVEPALAGEADGVPTP
jgi:large subunit ribosomal protein L25